jgi:mono/diheme cytochrome c family protein
MQRGIAVRRTITMLLACTVVLSACATGNEAGTGTAPAIENTQPGNPLAGATVYTSSCASCHAADLGGIDGLGNQLAPNDFIATTSEEDIAILVGVGRPTSDPLNTSGIDMPSRGGNPNLSDQDLRDVAAYLKGIQ